MTNFDDMTRKFCNHRQWRDFIAAVHDSLAYPRSMTYPAVLSALRSSRAWFNGTTAREEAHWNSCGCTVKR